MNTMNNINSSFASDDTLSINYLYLELFLTQLSEVVIPCISVFKTMNYF